MDRYKRIRRSARIVVLDNDDDDVYHPSDAESTSDSDAPLIKNIARRRRLQLTPRKTPGPVKVEMEDTTEQNKDREKEKENELHKSNEVPV